MGVSSKRSAPPTTIIGPSFSSISTRTNSTEDSPMEFGRNGDLVANTPFFSFPPSLGGFTRGTNPSVFALEKFHKSQRCEYSSIPRMASGFLYSGSNIIRASKSFTNPLCLGIPNFSLYSEWIFAITTSSAMYSLNFLFSNFSFLIITSR